MLGLLARESLSGYDLAGRMKERVGFFWEARHSQIYPELARLEGEGMVVHRVVEQRDRPDRRSKRSRTRPEGLREWGDGAGKAAGDAGRDGLKAYSVWLADPEKAVALFREQQRLPRSSCSVRGDRSLDGGGGEGLDFRLPRFASYAALRRGIIHERGYAEWCGWVADRLEKGGGAALTG